MSQVKKFSIALLIVFTVTACSNKSEISSACQPAVIARDNYLAEANQFWTIKNDEVVAATKVLDDDYQKCLSDPKTFLRNNKTSWGYQNTDCEEFRSYNRTFWKGSDDLEFKNMVKKIYLVVVNNQMCFKPEDVVEAQVGLENK